MNQYADILSRAEIPVCACPVHPGRDKQKLSKLDKIQGKSHQYMQHSTAVAVNHK
jgi:hypothetical protein